MTTLGTAYFDSFSSAVRYYRSYGYDAAGVEEKIRNNEIHIGKPTYNPNTHMIFTNDKGRYFIQTI